METKINLLALIGKKPGLKLNTEKDYEKPNLWFYVKVAVFCLLSKMPFVAVIMIILKLVK